MRKFLRLRDVFINAIALTVAVAVINQIDHWFGQPGFSLSRMMDICYGIWMMALFCWWDAKLETEI